MGSKSCGDTQTPALEAEKWMVKLTLSFVRLKHRIIILDVLSSSQTLAGTVGGEGRKVGEPAKLGGCQITASQSPLLLRFLYITICIQPSPWLLSAPPLKRTRYCQLYIPSQMNKDGRGQPQPSLLQTKGAVFASTLCANCYCQHFPPETPSVFFLKGKMKVVLKGSWSVEVHGATLVGIMNESGGDVHGGEVLPRSTF